MKKLRILQVTFSLDIGGLERVALDLARGLRQRGHHVELCSLSSKGVFGEEAEKDGFKIVCMNKKRGIDFLLPFKIAKVISGNEMDLIHTHNAAGLLYGASGAFLSGIRNIVHTEHGKELDYAERRMLQTCEKFFLKRLKSVAAVSSELRREILARHGLESDRVTVITNGIDTDHFYQPGLRAGKRKELGLTSNDFVIGNIARLVELKNHEFLISVFMEVANEFGKAKLLIAGDGPNKENLTKFTRSMGLEGSVTFLGERRDIAELLSTFDLFVLPSLMEGISITLLEAMAGGIPCVASRVGGNGEIIENGGSGILLDLGEPFIWAQAIKTLIQEEEKRRSIGEVGRRRVNEKFSLIQMVRNYEMLYENVLRQTGKRKKGKIG